MADPLAAPLQTVLDRLAASGLRGRGGGWFPTWRKWKAVAVENGAPIVVANGAEGEPGSIKDRFVMATRAADVLHGLIAAASTVKAGEAVVYLKASFDSLARHLENVLERVDHDGVDVTIRRGDDSYVGGEETAVVEWLETGRAWPRAKPPLPSSAGLRGRPTLVQNVETLSYVTRALESPERFAGADETLVSLWGQVRRPGVYAVPLGTPLRRVIDEWGGGSEEGVVAVFPAGPSGVPLRDDELDTPLDPDALGSVGSALGTAAVLVVGKNACPLSVLSSAADFFEREACGQCPPCTLGSRNMAALVRRLENGEARASEIGHVREIAGFMSSHGYCAHGRTDATVVTGGLARFDALVTAHIEARACPVSDVPYRPFDPDSPALYAIEATLAPHLPRA